MNAQELFLILEDLDDPAFLDVYRVVTKDGRPVTGVQIDKDKKTVVMVQRDTWIENRVDT
jgi:predicted secreted hydrolase